MIRSHPWYTIRVTNKEGMMDAQAELDRIARLLDEADVEAMASLSERIEALIEERDYFALAMRGW